MLLVLLVIGSMTFLPRKLALISENPGAAGELVLVSRPIADVKTENHSDTDG